MRDYSLQKQKKANRHPKSLSDQAKNDVKENLNPTLPAVSEHASEKDLNLSDSTSIEDYLIGELCEFSKFVFQEGSEVVPLSLAPTFDENEESVVSAYQPIIEKSENVNLGCIEAEQLVKHLESQLQLFNARTRELKSKRLLDALTHVIIKKPHEDDSYNEVIPWTAYFPFICFLMSILAAFLVFICFSGNSHTFDGPPPT